MRKVASIILTFLFLPLAVAAKGPLVLTGEIEWSGQVKLTRPVVVGESARLTILAGAVVTFALSEADWPSETGAIKVKGEIVSLGTAEAPVIMVADPPRPEGDRDMVWITDNSTGRFVWTRFRNGPWGLHIHRSHVTVENCSFTNGYGGVRFRGQQVTLVNNRFVDNRIGVRCLMAERTEIRGNTFSGNLTGIFFRTDIIDPVVEGNVFDDKEYDIKLGETQARDIALGENDWPELETKPHGERIFDGEDSEGVGRVRLATER